MCQLADWKNCSLKTDNSSDNSATASLEHTVPAGVWCSCNVSCCRASTFAFLHTLNNADMGLEPAPSRSFFTVSSSLAARCLFSLEVAVTAPHSLSYCISSHRFAALWNPGLIGRGCLFGILKSCTWVPSNITSWAQVAHVTCGHRAGRWKAFCRPLCPLCHACLP